MMELIWNKLRISGDLIALGILIILYLLTKSPNINSDSITYMNLHPMRPPVYPIFLWIFHSLGKYQLQIVVWLQTVFCFAGLAYARYWLYQRLQLSRIAIFFVLLFSVLLIFFHYRILESICSEGLAFPMFILTFFLLVDCFQTFNLKKLCLLGLLVNLIILTRAQFYYLYSLLFLLFAWYLWQKLPIKAVLQGLVILISLAFTTGIINHTYHYVVHGHFSDLPIVGIQLAIQPFYLSDLDSAKYFENPIEKEYYINVVKKLQDNHITIKSAHDNMQPPTTQIKNAYYTITYNPISAVLSNNKALKIYEFDPFILHISKILYLHNLKDNILFYLLRVSSIFGDPPFFIFYATILLAMGLSILRQPFQYDFKQLYITISLLTVFANATFVGIFEPVMPYYSLYTYFLFFCMAGVVIKLSFETTLKKKTCVE